MVYKKAVAKAEKAMMTACQKEFSEATKGKKFKVVAEWVESEEHGANADTFKKSKCYERHEAWEKASDQNEGNEKHEHKS